ncbi:MAG: galactokinase [Spirochaetaceae bacterium]|nr:galactokinase [Spirochaetaceae bacterium]MBQ8561319.1 galactokinase [Spirochaetaceae bacterium]MBR2362069.1 galactokinase [Spirochaetaceae bacterium]
MKEVIETHLREYGKKPDILVSTPGRFHLIGEHSWFCKDKTLSMAVNLPIYVAITVRDDAMVRFNFIQMNERKRCNLSNLKFRKEDRWANSIKAMIYGFTSGGFSVSGMDITIWSEILPSAGFGITTAMKVGTAFGIKSLCGCSEVQMLQAIERGNKLFLGAGNYVADIFAAMYAQPNSCILTDHATNTYDILPFQFENISILLTDARVPRISVWNEATLMEPENVLLLGELKERKSHVYGGWQYEESSTEINEVLSVVDEDMGRRLKCIMLEHKYVISAVDALQKQDFASFCKTVSRSQDIMRDLYLISCPEIDWLVKRVQDFDMTSVRNPNGCSRITGKGFGRCTYTILQTKDAELYKQKLVEYERIFGFHPSCYDVRPAGGVHLCDF